MNRCTSLPESLRIVASLCAFLLLSTSGAAPADEVPKSVIDTWAQFDPSSELLETELICESAQDNLVLRHIRFVVGTFGGKKTRVAAFYAFPKDGVQVPGVTIEISSSIEAMRKSLD